MTRIRCGTLIDGTGNEPVRDAVIEVEDGRIAKIAAGRSAQGDTLDLRGYTVLPGLIDCHEHLGIDIGDEKAQCAEPIEYIVARCVRTAGVILRGGITTIRDLGEKARIGPQMKRAIAEGIVQGPRVYCANQNIVRTGGHGWFLGRQADGVLALRTAVREEIRDGADLIKIMVSGGVSTPGSDVLAPEFATDEVAALIEEAHRRGRKVAAHGHGGPGVRDAVENGVDSIEHGCFLTRDDVQLMIDHGTYLTSTVGVMEEIRDGHEAPAFMKEKIGTTLGDFLRLMGEVRGAGLKIVLGTDENHGKLWREMEVLIGVGYTPMEMITAATREAAALVGVSDTIGTLEAGKAADLIAVKGDPLADVRALADVKLVMKGGRVEVQS